MVADYHLSPASTSILRMLPRHSPYSGADAVSEAASSFSEQLQTRCRHISAAAGDGPRTRDDKA